MVGQNQDILSLELGTELKAYRVEGGAGPHLLVFGAIHGNETCGPEALSRLKSEIEMGQLSLEQGTLTWVPVCNPRAHKALQRYSEENLNRVFEFSNSTSSYESELAQHLCPLFDGVDFFLDLHSMQSLGDPFVFLNEPNEASRKFCESLKLPFVLEGWPNAYRKMPQLKSACTQTFADKLGIPNALVECGRHLTQESALVGYECVLAALDFLEVGKYSLKSKEVSLCIDMRDIVLREGRGDSLSRDWKNFDPIRNGEVLAVRESGIDLLAPYDGYMILPSPDSEVGTELYYTGV